MNRNPNCIDCPTHEIMCGVVESRINTLAQANSDLEKSKATLLRSSIALNDIDAGIRFDAIEILTEHGLEPTEARVDIIDARANRTRIVEEADRLNTRAIARDALSVKVNTQLEKVTGLQTALTACVGPRKPGLLSALAKIGLTDPVLSTCTVKFDRTQ